MIGHVSRDGGAVSQLPSMHMCGLGWASSADRISSMHRIESTCLLSTGEDPAIEVLVRAHTNSRAGAAAPLWFIHRLLFRQKIY